MTITTNSKAHMPSPLPLSGVVIAKNEADRIGRCLQSMRAVCAEMLVLDCGSDDDTVAVARAAGARVEHQDWLGFAGQKNEAISRATQPWLLLMDADEWLARATTELVGKNFAIDRGGDVIGGIGFTIHGGETRGGVLSHSAEFGYWLAEPFWGQGIASEAAAFLTDWAFDAHKLVRIYAAVFHPNKASARVLEKSGFLFEGVEKVAYFKNGEYYDGLLYAKVRMPAPVAS